MEDLPLGELDAFTAVAKARSFRAAARLRHVSASSLSEAVRRLEERLKLRLLNRTTRSVTPTEAGARLLARLDPALSEVASALKDIDSFRDNLAGTLRLNVPTVAAIAILPPIINGFLKAYPGVTVDVVAEDSFIDVLGAGFDAGIRYDERLERDMIAIPIGPKQQRYVAAAAPSYLEANGTPLHPRDLLEHRCIRHRFLNGNTFAWEFERNGETVSIAPTASLFSNSPPLEVEAAVGGVGIIATFEDFLAREIADGRLVRILTDWETVFPGPSLYYASRRHMPAPLRAFVDFVKAWRG